MLKLAGYPNKQTANSYKSQTKNQKYHSEIGGIISQTKQLYATSEKEQKEDHAQYSTYKKTNTDISYYFFKFLQFVASPIERRLF